MDINMEAASANKEHLPSANVEMAENDETKIIKRPSHKRKKIDQNPKSKLTRIMKRAKISVTTTTVTMRLYRCRICFMSLASPDELVTHVKLVHNLRFEGPPSIQAPSPLFENGSDRGTLAMQNLSTALEESERQPYTEAEKRNLVKGMQKRTESVEKYFRCRLCFIDFKFIDELRHHMGLHAQNKIIPCRDCGMGFSTEYLLKKHRQEDLGGEGTIHKCTDKECTSEFTKRTCFLFHLTTHDGLHRCPTCEATYEYSDQVLQHITDVHILTEPDPETECSLSEDSFSGDKDEEHGEPAVVAVPPNPTAEESDFDLDEDDYEEMPPPESEKSDVSSDENEGGDPSGFNQFPYKCQYCPRRYAQISSLFRHEKINHRMLTKRDEQNKRILFPVTTKGRRGGRRGRGGRGGYVGSSRNLRMRPSTGEDVGINNPSEKVSTVELDTSMIPPQVNCVSPEYTEANGCTKIEDDSKEAISLPTREGRLTRSQTPRSSKQELFPHQEFSSSVAANTKLGGAKRNQESKRKCLKCPRLFGGINVLTRHLRADHLMDNTSIVIFTMLFGSVKCPFCIKSFTALEDEDYRMAQFHQHIEQKHPKQHFPSPSEIVQRQEEMKYEMEQHHSRDSTPPLIPKVQVEVMTIAGSNLGVRVTDVDVNSKACIIKVETDAYVSEEDAEIALTDECECPAEEKPFVLNISIPLTAITLRSEILKSEPGTLQHSASPARPNDNGEGKEKCVEDDSSDYLVKIEDVKKEEENQIEEKESDIAGSFFVPKIEPGPPQQPASPAGPNDNEESKEKHVKDDSSDCVVKIEDVEKEEENPIEEEKEPDVAGSFFVPTSEPGPSQLPASPARPNDNGESKEKLVEDDSSDYTFIIEDVEKEDEKPIEEEETDAAGTFFVPTLTPQLSELADWECPNELTEPLPVTFEESGISGTAEAFVEPADWTRPLGFMYGKPGAEQAFVVKPMMILSEWTVGNSRTKLVCYESLFRCLLCDQMFSSKEEMESHVTKLHLLHATDGDPTSFEIASFEDIPFTECLEVESGEEELKSDFDLPCGVSPQECQVVVDAV